MKSLNEKNRAVLSGMLLCGAAALVGAAVWMGSLSGGWKPLLLAVGAVACWLAEDRLSWKRNSQTDPGDARIEPCGDFVSQSRRSASASL